MMKVEGFIQPTEHEDLDTNKRQPSEPGVESDSNDVSGAFAAFRNSNYTWMWLGSFISNVGTWSQRVAEPWLVFQLSGSAFLLGLNGFAADFPMLVFLLVGGAIADRFNRKVILISAQLLQMLSALLIVILLVTDKIEVWVFIVLSFVVGCAQSMATPAYLSVLPTLVPKKHLANAIALNSTQFNLSRLIGPVVGGSLLVYLGATWCFGFNVITYAGIIVVLLFITLPKFEPINPDTKIWHSIKEGIDAVSARKELVMLVVVITSVSFFATPLITFLPVVATNLLDSDAQGFSFLLAAFGGGAVFGALVLASLGAIQNRFKLVLIASFALGLICVLLAFSYMFWLSLVLMFFAGLAYVSCGSTANTIMQITVEDHIRGRALSIYALAFRGGVPIGNLISGLIVQEFNVQVALVINGIILMMILLFTFQFRYKKIIKHVLELT